MNDRDIFRDTEGVLYNYSMLKAEIHNLELEIEELKDEYQGISAISYEEKTGPTNKTSDSVANEVIHKENVIRPTIINKLSNLIYMTHNVNRR